ncbi:MAG: flagellar assembly protein FliW [Clostridium sp.]
MEIKFKKGILGFEHLYTFILKELEDSNFKMLQSLEDEKISFVLISPFDIVSDYEIKLGNETVERIEVDTANDVSIFSLVTLNSDIKKITANLKAPIVINVKKNLGEQIIVDKEKYKIKHPLIKE